MVQLGSHTSGESVLYGWSGKQSYTYKIETGGYISVSGISEIDYMGLETLIVLDWNKKEMVAHNTGSYLGGQLDMDGSQCLAHGIPHDYMAVEVLVYRKLIVGVILEHIELQVACPL